jgi:hypothetical protein
MTSSKRRLDKLEVSLTPKQAILLWMEEAHQYGTMEQYVRSLKPGPEAAWPLAMLPDKISTAVEQAMKGRPRQEIVRRARQSIRDVLFLFHLHQQVNQKFMEEDRHYWTRALLLSTELDALRRERSLRDQMTWNWFRVGLELPYPLGCDTAAAVEAAKEHYVLTWELLEEGDQITGWVQEYFAAQGKSELPDGAYSLQEASKWRSTTGPTEGEVRALFRKGGTFRSSWQARTTPTGLPTCLTRSLRPSGMRCFRVSKLWSHRARCRRGSWRSCPWYPTTFCGTRLWRRGSGWTATCLLWRNGALGSRGRGTSYKSRRTATLWPGTGFLTRRGFVA